MNEITEEQVLHALRVVQDPDLHRDIVTLGFVKNIKICGGSLGVTIELTTPACPVKDILKAEAEDALRAIPGISSVQVEMTAVVRTNKRSNEQLIPGVRNVIAVASGKGGVGKSTVSVNLAIALAQTGARVGLLDADIYGPSIPMMMGVNEKPLTKTTPEGVRIVPLQAHGVLLMSLGFLIDPERAVVWRGPMVGSAVKQLVSDVLWGNQDYLVIDLPPGTGDASLTLAQIIPISGVVLVTTPQKVAQEIANKAALMFQTLSQDREIPILGVVENMCGSLFGIGSGDAEVNQFGRRFLGKVPMALEVSEGGDAGYPVILSHPDSAAAVAFHSIASQVAAGLSILQFSEAETSLAQV